MRTIARYGTLPVAVTVLTAITALYYALVAFTNWTDFGTNQSFVDHVLAMDTTFNDPDVMWRRIDNNVIVNIAYVGVIIWESLIAIVLGMALVMWIKALRGGQGTGAARYEVARRLSTLGWIMVFVLFAGGFITVGGEYFQMWQSSAWNGLTPALQNFLIAGIGIVLAHLHHGDEGPLPAAVADAAPATDQNP